MRRSTEILSVALGAVMGAVLADSACWYVFGGDVLVLDLVKWLGVPAGFVLGIIAGWKAAFLLERHLQRAMRHAPKRTKVLYLSSIVVGLISVSVTCADLARHARDMPSDEQLISNFTQNRAAFDQLAAMVQKDRRIYAVDTNWYLNDEAAGIAPERMAQYKERLYQANIRRGVQYRANRQGIEFSCWVIGSGLFSTKTKGYWYSQTSPSLLVPTLDKPKARLAYRRITGNWYLFYEHFTD